MNANAKLVPESKLKEPMTPRQFAAAMRKLSADHAYDAETFHIEADELMCKLLTQLGYGSGVRHFVLQDRNYS